MRTREQAYKSEMGFFEYRESQYHLPVSSARDDMGAHLYARSFEYGGSYRIAAGFSLVALVAVLGFTGVELFNQQEDILNVAEGLAVGNSVSSAYALAGTVGAVLGGMYMVNRAKHAYSIARYGISIAPGYSKKAKKGLPVVDGDWTMGEMVSLAGIKV